MNENPERQVEIDIGKLLPLGLIPLAVMLVVYLGAVSKTNRVTSELKASVDSSRSEVRDLSKSVDSLAKNTKSVIKLACDKFDPRAVRLTELKCPQ